MARSVRIPKYRRHASGQARVTLNGEGKTRKEAARQLGSPEGTIAGRLARAMAMLAMRLTRHGLAVSGGALAAVLSQSTAAGVPNTVVSSTIKAASLYAAGKAAATGVISSKVVALAEGVLKAMLLTKLKIGAVVLVTFFGFIAGVWTCSTLASEPKRGDTPQEFTDDQVVALAGAFSAVGAQAPAEPPKPKDGPLGMKFVPLPKGKFYMGWNGEKGSAKKTEIKEDFEIAIHTVTQGQWQDVMGKNPNWYSRDGEGKNKVKDFKDEELKQFPVERVSWDDTQEFIKKLNEKEKGKGWLYRLPSEAEWEYACRGGATSEEECSYYFYFDKPTNDLSSKQANFNGNKPAGNADKGPYLERTTKVGSYAPNKLGLYDMHGNVLQWCEDLYEALGAGASSRVIRGGNWFGGAGDCRASLRGRLRPVIRSSGIGFRLARVPVR